MRVVDIARVCHEVNKAYCESQGDFSQSSWDGAPEWQRMSAVDGVDFHLAHPNSKPEDSHTNWLQLKLKEGWKFAPVKNAEKKEHPCCVPFDKLPPAQQAKDYLFLAVVRNLRGIK